MTTATSKEIDEERATRFKGLLRHRRPTRRGWLLIAAALTILILIVVIPLAVVLPRRARDMGPKSSVIVPLYVYPSPGAWDPLHQA